MTNIEAALISATGINLILTLMIIMKYIFSEK